MEVGRALSAEKALATSVLKLGSRSTVSAVLYDLETASSAGGASARGPCDEDGIVSALEEVVSKLAGGTE